MVSIKDKRLAIFDFCETIVAMQSADSFIDFVRDKTPSRKRNLLEFLRSFLTKLKFFSVINKLFPKNNIHKKLKLLQLSGIPKSTIEELSKNYYEDVLKDKLIPKIIDELKQKQSIGYRIIILSGGYTVYIKHFAETVDINSSDIIATDICFDKKDICKGIFQGVDCMNENKIIKMKKKIKDIDEFNLHDSYAYSDSISDLPLLNFVGNGIVVAKNKQQWMTENNFNLILWN